jgi:hypothetical protein
VEVLEAAMLKGFERALLKRHLTTSVITASLFMWLVAILLVPRFVLVPIGNSESPHWDTLTLYTARSFELVFPMALALALARTILALRSQKVIDSIVAAGYPPRRWRLILALTAASTVFGNLLIFEFSNRIQADRTEAGDRFWFTQNGKYVWRTPIRLHPHTTYEALVFDLSSCDLSAAKRAEIQGSTLHLLEAQTIYGDEVSHDYPLAPRQRSNRSVPSIASVTSARATWSEALAYFDRVVWGGLLVLLVGYGALLVPCTYRWAPFALVPVFACLLGLAAARSSNLLWAQTGNTPAVEFLAGATFLGTWLCLDRTLCKRGLGP